MQKIRLAFFGTPEFAADLLEKIITDQSLPVEVALVVTQPDRPVGRKKILTPSPVKKTAKKHRIKVFDDLLNSKFKILDSRIDLALIYYYGQIIPTALLTLPRFGFWNIHFSRLPQYRGASPATFSLIMGDSETAISLVQTDSKLDHGPLISQDGVDIDPQETRLELEQKLHEHLLEILRREIAKIEEVPARLKEQDHAKATYTLFPTKTHGFVPFAVLKKALANEPLNPDEIPSLILDYSKKNKLEPLGQLEIRNSSKIIFDYFRGLYPWPGLWTNVIIKDKNMRLKITDMSLSYLPSTIYQLLVNRVQLEGKTEVDFEQFNEVYQVF